MHLVYDHFVNSPSDFSLHEMNRHFFVSEFGGCRERFRHGGTVLRSVAWSGSVTCRPALSTGATSPPATPSSGGTSSSTSAEPQPWPATLCPGQSAGSGSVCWVQVSLLGLGQSAGSGSVCWVQVSLLGPGQSAGSGSVCWVRVGLHAASFVNDYTCVKQLCSSSSTSSSFKKSLFT